MTHLTEESIDAFIASHKKSGDLLKAYKIAKDPHDWNAKQTAAVRDHEAALATADDEDTTKKRKQPAAPASRKKRKDEADEAPKEEPKEESKEEHEEELDPQTKKVREWRHKLQRAFLSKDGVIKPEDMEAQDATLKIVEAYDEITPEQLKATKIGKVMKRIHQLPEVPKDDQFHFRERAGALMNKWGAILGATLPADA